MKNKAGKLIGFAIGMAGFLTVFKVFFLPNIPPEDELAPGAVVILSVINGVIFGIAGNLLQNYFNKKSV